MQKTQREDYMSSAHSAAALLIMSLVLSAAFLVWVGEKKGNPNQRAGTIIAIVAIVLSSLFIAGRVYRCISMYSGRSCDRSMMMKMHRGDRMERGMKMHDGMGMKKGMKTPPPPAN
jgi:hypothetical protein